MASGSRAACAGFLALVVVVIATAWGAGPARADDKGKDSGWLSNFLDSQAKLRAETREIKENRFKRKPAEADASAKRRDRASTRRSRSHKPDARAATPRRTEPQQTGAASAAAKTTEARATPDDSRETGARETRTDDARAREAAKPEADRKEAKKKQAGKPEARKREAKAEEPADEKSAALSGAAGYIRAPRAPVARAFGDDLAKKIFSHAFTPVRQLAINRSAQLIPGFDCPNDPPVALMSIDPTPVKQAKTAWVEHYIVGCTPNTRRNFLVMLENDKPQVAELLPGRSAADPVLQKSAVAKAESFVKDERPQGCDSTVFTDSRLAEPRIGVDRPWVELWSYDQCGKDGKVEMTFTPLADGNTAFTPKIIR